MVAISAYFPTARLRRLRQHPRVRDLVREVELNVNDLIMPLFVRANGSGKYPIQAMPGHYQWTLPALDEIITQVQKSGVPGVLLFGIPEHKDAEGSAAWQPNGVIPMAIRRIKQLAPELLVIADVCFCEYTDHGHCGLVQNQQGVAVVDNDATLALLAKQAVVLAEAGADMLAPSGMMDGMVQALRTALDTVGYQQLPILSYAVKYSSSLYAPFREAAEGVPQFGNRSGYQMDIANAKEALREAALDINEGADMLMVKPALAYLDIIYRVKQAFPEVPMAAYHVSGEFAMLKAAAMQGWLDEAKVALETLTAIKRAGADFIITYYALEAAHWLKME
ncbi:MAG: porphobilinogen synthase [Coxiellaceae bacterium]|nr:MAG: porphobilinogen synthase [Coxiellaceae bacterium]